MKFVVYEDIPYDGWCPTEFETLKQARAYAVKRKDKEARAIWIVLQVENIK